MVLAARCYRQLFSRSDCGSTVGPALAWNIVRDGHDRDLKHTLRRTDRPGIDGRRQANWRGRTVARPRISALRGRSILVERSSQNAAGPESTSLLRRMGCRLG